MQLSDLTFQAPPEAFAASDLEKGCAVPLVEQKGVAAWRSFLLGNYGGRNLGIVRACDVGGPSEHKTGRAFDWGMNANDPHELAVADGLVAELLAPDDAGNEAALFRRLGLMYIIWNRQVWSVRTKSWQPYTGSSPHTDHVHFSFGWPGAKAQTSFFSTLGIAPDLAQPAAPSRVAGAALVVLLGGVAGWYASRWAESALFGNARG